MTDSRLGEAQSLLTSEALVVYLQDAELQDIAERLQRALGIDECFDQ